MRDSVGESLRVQGLAGLWGLRERGESVRDD